MQRNWREYDARAHAKCDQLENLIRRRLAHIPSCHDAFMTALLRLNRIAPHGTFSKQLRPMSDGRRGRCRLHKRICS